MTDKKVSIFNNLINIFKSNIENIDDDRKKKEWFKI